MSILVETAPRTIWLCVSDDEDDYDLPYPELYAEDAEITWSTDQPVAVTVRYMRADLEDSKRVDNERLRADLEAARSLLTKIRKAPLDQRLWQWHDAIDALMPADQPPSAAQQFGMDLWSGCKP